MGYASLLAHPTGLLNTVSGIIKGWTHCGLALSARPVFAIDVFPQFDWSNSLSRDTDRYSQINRAMLTPRWGHSTLEMYQSPFSS